METLNLVRIASVHTHLREGAVVGPLIEKALDGGACALCPMPNTTAGLTTAASVTEYIRQAKQFTPEGKQLHFLPIVMVTEQTTERDLDECVAAGITDAKIYPRDRTTKSEKGVVRYGSILPILKHGGDVGIRFHFHPEHPSLVFSNRDAEFAFLPLVRMFLEETNATIVWEHGTDARCISHWKDMATSRRFFVTLTAHHLVTNEDDTFGDVRAACKPPIKTEEDRRALVELVGEGYSWVMAGADDAPHPIEGKHVHKDRCACGAYTSPFLLLLYAHALGRDLLISRTPQVAAFLFYNAVALHPQLSRQCSAEFVGIKREPFQIPLSYDIGPWKVEPFWAGRTLDWSFA